MKLGELIAALERWREQVGADAPARILVDHPLLNGTGVFDLEGVDVWEELGPPLVATVMVQSFPAERPPLELVPSG